MKNTLFSEKSLSCTQIKTIREKVHCSQFEFASMLNVSVGTLRNWEQGRRKPDGAAIALLKLFSTNPEATAQSLSTYSVIDNFSDSEKKKIILSLNWDYEVDSDHILQVVKTENTNEKKQLFAKTFQYLHWQDVVRFWGMSVCLEMNNQTVRKMLIPSLRRKYDFIYGTILETNLSNAGFGASDSAKLFNSLLSHRRDSAE